MHGKAISSVLLCVLAGVSASCGKDGTLPATECSLDFSRNFDARFDNGKVDALLESTAKLNVTANAIEADVLAACNGIATDLGAASAPDVETACMNASTAIDGVLAANASITLVVEVVPAVCTVNAEATATCAAMCDASFDATATPPTCEGGMLSGSCSAMCTGSCTVEGSVDCTGSCSGTCTGSCSATVEGSCDGTCNGQCEGTCSAMDGDGNCMGTCDGTCRGQCMGTVTGSCGGECMGSCMGSCRADVTGMCDGRCTGECSVDFEAPRCEGGEVNVMADAECQASCEADASFDAECTEPEVIVSFTGAADTAADLDALAATLSANLPAIVSVLEKAEIIVMSTAQFANALDGVASAAVDAGVEASLCVAEALDVEVAALAKINVSVEASVMVSGSVSASGG